MEAGNGWRRQHPAACFFNILQAIRGLLFPIIAGAVAARGIFLVIFLGMMLVFSIGAALLRYWRYRYRFAEHELVVEQGWLYRQVRHISYVRIQNINITRNLFHRLFRVSGMQLESASGSEPEAVMEALSQPAIEELEQRVSRAKESGDSPEGAEGREGEGAGGVQERKRILRLGAGELIRHGLVSNRGMVLVAAAIGFLFHGPVSERYLPNIFNWVRRFTGEIPTETIEAFGPLIWFLGGLMVFLLIMLGLALLSVIYAVLRYYGFTLSGDPKSLRAEYGLLTRVSITMPRRRVQLIGLRANPLHRLLRRLAVRVETAGFTGPQETHGSLRWLAPILPESEAPRVLGEVQPDVCWEGFEWRSLHPKTRARLLRVRLVFLGIAILALALGTGLYAFLAILAVPLLLAYARGYFRYAGWAVNSEAIAFRSGWLVRQQSFVRYPKIQTVTLSRNPFDRRWGMATLSVDTAGADPTGHGIHIRFLDYESARDLRDLLEEKTRKTRFEW